MELVEVLYYFLGENEHQFTCWDFRDALRPKSQHVFFRENYELGNAV